MTYFCILERMDLKGEGFIKKIVIILVGVYMGVN